MAYERFRVVVEDHVADVRINRPERANALDRTGWRELGEIFGQLDRAPQVRVVVLSGEGKHFCSGADQQFLMENVATVQDESAGHGRERLLAEIVWLQEQVTAVERCRKPVLAAIHGACVGGAVDIVTACDICYATRDAFFAIAEIDLGIVADLGTLQRLPTILPKGLVRELALTGRRMGAEEAQRYGLVTSLFDGPEQMRAAVTEIARSIAARSPIAVRGIKRALTHARNQGVAEGLQRIALWNAAMLLNEDLNEAVAARMERRDPRFRD